jgi:hypothetical protein
MTMRVMPHNVPNQRLRATDPQHEIERSSRSSLRSVVTLVWLQFSSGNQKLGRDFWPGPNTEVCNPANRSPVHHPRVGVVIGRFETQSVLRAILNNMELQRKFPAEHIRGLRHTIQKHRLTIGGSKIHSFREAPGVFKDIGASGANEGQISNFQLKTGGKISRPSRWRY